MALRRKTFSRVCGALWPPRPILVGPCVAGLGVLSGLLLTSSLSSLFTSIIGILVYLLVIVSNPLQGLLLWVSSAPLTETAINIPLGAGIPDLSPSRFCAVFLCTLLLAQTAIHKRDLVHFTGADWSAILFLIGVSLSASESPEGWRGLQTVFDLYCIPILGYFLAKNFVCERKHLNMVLLTTLLIGTYAALYAFYEHGTGQILFAPENINITVYADSGLRILRGLFQRNVHFGALFSMAIPINFYLCLKASTRWEKWFYIVTLGILFAGLFLTYRRTAWIATMMSLFVIQGFYPQFRRLFITLLLIFLVVIGITWNSVSQSVVVTERIGSKKSTIEGRTEGWNAALELWTRRPLFGYGFNTYSTVARERGIHDEAIENEYVEVLFSAGLVGFVPYITMFTLFLKDSVNIFRQLKKKGHNVAGIFVEQGLMVIFWGILLGYLVVYSTSEANNAFVSTAFYVLVGALVGSQAHYLRWCRGERVSLAQVLRAGWTASRANSSCREK